MPKSRRVTLLTDFGTADGYVGAMKGVIAGIAEGCIIDDASHDIPPGDVQAAAWALGAYWRRYPPGTVHVVVIDPGVGSGRRALAVAADERCLVGPDNGVFTHVLREAASSRCFAVHPERVTRDVISATFHGRDLFAPLAARIAAGAEPAVFGDPIDDPVVFGVAAPGPANGDVEGRVVHVDRFGNLVTNIPASAAAGRDGARIGATAVPLVRAYSDVDSGEVLALCGSRDTVEIAVRDGNAADVLGAGRGDRVTLL